MNEKFRKHHKFKHFKIFKDLNDEKWKAFENIKQTKNPWPESANDRRLSAKLVPTFADRGCHVVSVTDPYGRFLDFLDRNRYFFFQIAPQLLPRGCVDPVPDPLLLRKSGSAGNRTRTSEDSKFFRIQNISADGKFL
jgi:hypothetical protein